MGGLLDMPERLIRFPAAQIAAFGLAHAVHVAPAARQRFVHPHHDGANLRRRLIAREHAVEPFHLVGIELLRGRIVQRNKIDVALDPVIVGVQLVIHWIVLQPLRTDRRRLQPIGELYQPRFARHGRNGLMIANRQVDRQRAERNNLVLDEIRPRIL